MIKLRWVIRGGEKVLQVGVTFFGKLVWKDVGVEEDQEGYFAIDVIHY